MAELEQSGRSPIVQLDDLTIGKIAAGEVVMYHPPTGSYVKFKTDGNIEVQAPNIKLNGDVLITGTLDVQGVSTLEDTLEVKALSTLAGITTSGAPSATFGATMTSNGKDMTKTHTHDDSGNYQGGGSPVTGNSGIPE